MKFLAIDLETTGTDKQEDQILEIALVYVDTKTSDHHWPKFYKIVRHDRYSGSAYAINLNARIFNILAEDEENPHNDVIHADNLSDAIYIFLKNCGIKRNDDDTFTVTPFGKNPHGFDVPFLVNHPGIKDVIRFRQRSIDPTILFADWDNDDVLPTLETCKERAGMGSIVTHNAMEDIMDTINVLLFKIR